jgi:hypothetical protein
MPRKARNPEGGRRPIPRSEGHPFLQIAARSGGYSGYGRALHEPHARSLPAQIARKRPPHCRYCGEPSILPWGGQQVCARCEAIRCRIEQAAFPAQMGDDELYRAVMAALAARAPGE